MLAFVHYLPDWVPTLDPAFMGMRALDVGTSRTPFIGQPSLAGNYVPDHYVNHLGPTHFYLLAPFVQLLGARVGMMVVSALITGSCLLIAGWATYRELGPRGGVLGATILGLITFTTGASTLINPVSSNIAGYPLLCSMILLWCLMCGDVRLLPLTTVLVSFTAQQHLSVLPSLAVATLAGTAALVVGSLRAGSWRDPAERRQLATWGGLSAGLGLAVWAPVLLQQVAGSSPNLTQLVSFTINDDRPSLGYGTSLRQLVHVLGLPPTLGQPDLTTQWLFDDVSVFTAVTAGLVVAAGIAGGVGWRRSHPRRSMLAVMAAVAAIGGFFNSASIPTGNEQYRLAFYHWIFPLLFFMILGFGLAADDVLERLGDGLRRWLRTGLLGAALLGVTASPMVGLSLVRWSNTLVGAYSPIDHTILDELADEVMRHDDELAGNVAMLARGTAWFMGIQEALALELDQRGLPVKHPREDGAFVDEDRLLQPATLDVGIVVFVNSRPHDGRNDLTHAAPPDGSKLIADVRVPPDFDHEADEVTFVIRPTRIRVYLLPREDVLDWATAGELMG